MKSTLFVALAALALSACGEPAQPTMAAKEKRGTSDRFVRKFVKP